MIYSECIVCKKIYDIKEDGKKDISYSHGYCGKACMEISKKLSRKKRSQEEFYGYIYP